MSSDHSSITNTTTTTTSSTAAVTRMGISHLPDELLLQIFSHFPQEQIGGTLSKVCRRFNRISKDSIFWFKTPVNLIWGEVKSKRKKGRTKSSSSNSSSSGDDDISMDRIAQNQYLIQFLNSGVCLQKLTLKYRWKWEFPFSELRRPIFSLTKLSLHQLSLSSTTFISSVQTCFPNLEELRLNYCSFQREDEEGAKEGVLPFNKLKSLQMTGMDKRGNYPFLTNVVLECKELTSSLRRIKLDFSFFEEHDILQKIMDRCSNLEILNFLYVSEPPSNTKFNPALLPNLRALIIEEDGNYEGDILLPFIESPIERLVYWKFYFDVNGYKPIITQNFLTFIRHPQRKFLKRVYLSRWLCFNEIYLAVVNHCPNLEFLFLEHEHLDIEPIIRYLRDGKRFKNLKRLFIYTNDGSLPPFVSENLNVICKARNISCCYRDYRDSEFGFDEIKYYFDKGQDSVKQ